MQLRDFVAKENLTHRVFFIDECQDMRRLYTVSDIVVSASTKSESLGRVVIESQAAGCITIATNLGGPKEIIVPGETGFLVKPGCSVALQKAMQVSFDLSEQQLLQMQQRAKTQVKQKFSREIMLAKLQSVYEQFMAGDLPVDSHYETA